MNLITQLKAQKFWILGAALVGAYVVLRFLMAPAFVFSYETVRKNFRPSDTVILDRNDKIIYRTRENLQVRRLQWTELNQINPHIQNAILTAEDRRFYWHPGVDPISIITSMRDNLQGSVKRGASTISMQVASLLHGDKSPGRRSISEKFSQMGLAILLELAWSKDEILEAYLNLIPFRGELEGISAASFGLFDKAPKYLSTKEASLLAALVRAPNANPKRVADRACTILNDIDPKRKCDTLETIATTAFNNPSEIRMEDGMAYHATRFLLASLRDRQRNSKFLRQQEANGVVHATLDSDLQEFASNSLQRHVEENRSQNMNDGAVVVLDNRTGDVMAYVGNIGTESTAKYVDGAQAKRQVGSTLKPFVFGLGIDERILTAATILDDAPFEIAYENGTYRPMNYDKKFRGPVTARVSLASSLNIPSVKAIQLVGVDKVVQLLHELGVSDLRSPEHYGPALALGASDLTLWELTNAYRALANKGQFSKPSWFKGDRNEHVSVLGEDATFIISDILSDRAARSATFGLENMLSTPFWSAVKTGTSKDMRDNWCIGYSQHYTVGVWTGNFSGAAMWNVSGVHGAAPVWMDIMMYLHRNLPSKPFQKPEGVIRSKVHLGHLDRDIHEYFLKGTEPRNEINPLQIETAGPRIANPKHGTIYAIDPDIPRDRLNVSLKVDGWQESLEKNERLQLLLNGKPIEVSDSGRYLWSVKRGKYRLALKDESGEIIDSVRFFVK